MRPPPSPAWASAMPRRGLQTSGTRVQTARVLEVSRQVSSRNIRNPIHISIYIFIYVLVYMFKSLPLGSKSRWKRPRTFSKSFALRVQTYVALRLSVGLKVLRL